MGFDVMGRIGTGTAMAMAMAVALTAVAAAAGPSGNQTPPAPPAARQKAEPKPAMSLPRPFFTTSTPEARRFVLERVYNYERMQYTPQALIQRVSREAATYNTPEEAFIAQMSAMLAGDYDWWISGWDEAAQELQRTQNEEQKRTPADWRGIWERVLKGQQIYLVERLETGPYGPYVILVYSLRQPGTPGTEGRETFRGMFVSREVGGRWLATQDLARDPMFHYYTEGQDRVTLTER
jgi:hypothetical protein